MMAALLSEEPSQLLRSINVEAIANKLGMDNDQVTAGLEAITPVISKAFSQNNNNHVGAAAALAWGEITSSVKKFFK